MPMPRTTSPLTCAIALTAILFGMQTLHAAEADATLRVDCKQRYISQADAARLVGSNNPWQTFHGRQRLYAQLARACAGQHKTVMLIHRRHVTENAPSAAR